MQSCGLEGQASPELEAERCRSEQPIFDRLLNDNGVPEMFIISVGHQAVCCNDVGYIHCLQSLFALSRSYYANWVFASTIFL